MSHLFKAILFKVISALLFAVMSALVRWLGSVVPVGEIVFFRSACAILPVVVIYALRGELAAMVRTERLRGHIGRGTISIGGMFASFGALARLPLVETTAIQFSSPLITVALAALLLNERVRIYRWSAVAIGFAGTIVMLFPNLDAAAAVTAGATTSGVGALLALISACCNAGTVIQTRRLTQSETTSSIVFYFSLICAFAGLATLPFAWHAPSAAEFAALVCVGVLGGVAHLFLTESYRYASASMVAPFDYTAMVWAFIIGYAAFGEVPTPLVFVGSAIVAGAGLFVIWRERRLGMRRERAPEALPNVV